MENFGKTNFYGGCAGGDAGEDILDSLQGGSSNYQGSMEVLLQHMDQDQFNQIDVTSSGETHHQATKEYCSLPQGSIVSKNGHSQRLASNSDLEKAEKKRKIDQAYRERCKKTKTQMMRDLNTFGDENECLRVENKTLKEQNASMTQTLQSQTKELHQHKNRLDQLKFESEKQNALVQVLSDLVVNSNLCHENQKLKDENAQLRQMVKLSGEPLKLVQENGKLKHENMLLKVQIDALCGKIVDDNRKNCGH
ncbi:hypothetical protein QUC31_002596 [Theobroma cacao]